MTIPESDGNYGRSSRIEQGAYTVNDKLVDFTFGCSGFNDCTIDETGCIYVYQSDRFCQA